jgi:YD repeat-containing protein
VRLPTLLHPLCCAVNAPVTYDAADNMTAWGGHTYAFDSLGQLQRVTGTGINHTFLYTADGERIADRDATRNATTLTVRDLGGKVLRSRVKSGTAGAWVKDYVCVGASPLASVAADPTLTFPSDTPLECPPGG